MRKIVITGGHLTPAHALINELKKRGGWQIYYLGRKYSFEGKKILSAEFRIIPSLGVKFISITTGRLQRKFTRYTIFSLLKIPFGFIQSFYYLFKIKPDVICSFGGYVSVPIVIAGFILRIPILTHEQTVVFGLSSKINSFFASKIAVSFPESLKYFPKDKVVLTGNPIREEVFKIKKPSFLSPSFSKPFIYVTGGNQGSQTINRAILEILKRLLKQCSVIHQCGNLDYEFVRKSTLNLDRRLRSRYFLIPFVGPEDIGWILNNADLVVSRAGANIICELAALGKPALLIPIPWTYQDEQTKNALFLSKTGLAEILPEKELTGDSLFLKITEMLGSLSKYRKKGAIAKKLIKKDAAQRIVKELYALAK
jgi:UDP-N-acetylglucosamine--N-acetylmuramyl-(pentapeptide) pyrophosphoryl-undecaprenol N-acetylglucosamine transferase